MAAVYYAWKGYNGGKALSLGAIEQGEAAVYGMHGYPTAAEAEAHPNSVNAIEKPQVNAWVVAANDITGNPGADAKKAAGDVAGAIGNDTGITAVGDFVKGLAQPNLWIRIAKITVGSVILIVGLAKLTGAGGVAAKAVKYAPLL